MRVELEGEKIALTDKQSLLEEDSTIKILTRKSKAFGNFWKGERERFSTVAWVKDLSLPKGTDARVFHKEAASGKIKCMILLNPESIKETFIIAHEMGHALLAKDGLFLKINIHKQNNPEQNKINLDLLMAISDMFQDPVVDLMLQDKYGFNLKEQCIKDLRKRKKLIKAIQEPKDHLVQVIGMTDYVRYALYCILMKNEDVSKTWSAVQTLSMSKWPITSKMGSEAISIIEEVGGIDTLEKQRVIFEKISEKYRLQDILYLE